MLTMNPFCLVKILLMLSFCFVLPVAKAQRNPIALHPRNPHYFIYKNQPLILVTSGEHYGAVLNLDFDYRKYLDELYTNGLNLTRLFTGAYIEPQGSFNIDHNTLAPSPGKYRCPWSRSNEPGYAHGGNKFDLAQWDTLYFHRLKDFVTEAEKRNIIIELAFFCPFYDDSQWAFSPMNEVNNINDTRTVVRTDVYTLDKSGPLLKIQDALVQKIVNELKGFSNIIYEICNEPYFGGVTIEWQHHIASLVTAIEKDSGHPHLISQNIANGSLAITDPHPAVSVFNFHYATPPATIALNYHLNKVIGDNETGFNGNADSTYRKEGWQFIMAGGSLYNNLDYSFAPAYENGRFPYGPKQPGGGSKVLRQQLGYLKKFMAGFDYINMRPDSTAVTVISPGTGKVYSLVQPGKQYGIYIAGGKQATLGISLPPGLYSVQWINPVTGKTQQDKAIKSNGKITLKTPPYDEDIALRLLNTHL